MNFLDILVELGKGAGYTALVTLVCAATGFCVGLCISGWRRMGCGIAVKLLDAYTYVFRGVPLLVLLFLMYFGLPAIGLKVSPLLAMVLSLGLISGAYLAEVFRGALNLIDGSEILAAQAMGMSKIQILLLIEFPQMLRFALPGIVNEFTTVLKYSPFAYTVGIPEITKQAMALSATTMRGLEIYLAVGVLYFALYRLFLLGVQFVERQLRIPGIVPP